MNYLFGNSKIDHMMKQGFVRYNTDEIVGFFGPYRFLSNFWECQVPYDGFMFPSSENAYVAAKTNNRQLKRKIMGLAPAEVKAFGKRLELREDWETVKLSCMEEIVLAKFTFNEDLRNRLIETGNRHLEESNWWRDTFWGTCLGQGHNHLGNILMKTRDILRNY